MSPKKRSFENKGLPARWRLRGGAYRYQVPPGLEHLWDGKKEFTLGKTLPEAHRVWASRVESVNNIQTMADLFTRYARDVLPTKKASTARGQASLIIKLSAVFGELRPQDVKASHAYSYHDRRTAKTAAKREIELLSHTLTKAVHWGVIDRNPLTGLELETSKKVKRETTDADIECLLSLNPINTDSRGRKTHNLGVSVVQAYVKFKLLTGMRRTDILRLKMSNLKEDGVYFEVSKTGTELVIEITEALREAIDECKSVRPVHLSPYLFCTRRGEPYIQEDATANGFESMWQRVMAKLPAKHRFAERTLRNKASNDAESLEHAQQLLAHSDQRTTKKNYRTKAERVRPIR